jgi:alanine-synthesizing transaminase
MFSSRAPADLQPNRFARAIADARAKDRPIIDLTLTNPTKAGFDYPSGLLRALASPAALSYDPQPLGSRAAREAVRRDYARRGIEVATEQIVLTASTSEAYALLFKLLCEPSGDAVLVPVPSYPLFDHLTRLEGVTAVPYRLDPHGAWSIDPAALDVAWSSRVRAVLVVSPNNPTGSVLSSAERRSVDRFCEDRSAALVVDEVFADYPLRDDVDLAAGRTAPADVLTFRLGGLSKSAGLPQVKLGWIAVDGPAPGVADALDRLEFVCDTYLSVSTPVQIAADELVERGSQIRAQILARVRDNYATLTGMATAYRMVEVLPAAAGWSAVIRVPATEPEEALVLTLLERSGVVVHPGYFFDFPHEAFIVVSLLPPTAEFSEGVHLLLEHVDGR